MNLWPFGKKEKAGLSPQFVKAWQDTLTRLIESQKGSLGALVTPDTCMQSPTVHAIVTAISRRIASTPVMVYQQSRVDGRLKRESLPNHPVTRLLQRPNQWQTGYEFWEDAASNLVRWGRFHAYKARGSTGPIQRLIPFNPGTISFEQDPQTYDVDMRVTSNTKTAELRSVREFFNIRGPARDFVTGDSPVYDCNTAIALEIMAERFGANFFKNGALPLLIFKFMEGSSGFDSDESEQAFLDDLRESFGGDNALSSMLLPKGIDAPTTVGIRHDEAQFLETRKLQRTVIAGAFGVPPHLVGDLERGTFNNVEQQDKEFTANVVTPWLQAIEAAAERDLLTDQDRRSEIVVRFDVHSAPSRASFKERQEGLSIQRQMGVINADEWREIEGRNPRDDEYGDEFLHPGNMLVDGEEQDEPSEDDGSAFDQGTE